MYFSKRKHLSEISQQQKYVPACSKKHMHFYSIMTSKFLNKGKANIIINYLMYICKSDVEFL